MVGALLGALGQWCGLEFPTVRFPFAISHDIGWLHFDGKENTVGFLWFGWLYTVIAFAIGLLLALRFARGVKFTPLTVLRIDRFKSIKRGYYSLWIIAGLAAVAALDHVLVGNEALVVKYDGEWSFPAFTSDIEAGEKYGVEGDAAKAPPNYRQLRRQFSAADAGDFVWMPLIPYAPTGDNVGPLATPLAGIDD